MTEKNYNRRTEKDYNFFRTLYYMAFVMLVVLPVTKFMYNLKIEGRENLPKDSHVIYAGNHVSYIDPPLIALAAWKTIAYMAKQELFKTDSYFKRWVTRNVLRLGGFAVNREKVSLSTIKSVKEVFKANYNLCIFPQGGIRKNKVIENINEGFIYFAKTNKIDILPVALDGLETYNWKPFKKQNVNIHIGQPISYTLDEKEIIKEWSKQICELTGYENKM